MDYPFENLSPEKFQLFCQALLVRERPGLQCFPVAQPDGGRDALQWQFNRLKSGFAAFQVKFARQPDKIEDVYEWMTDIVELERDKIKRLVEAGASEYILVTNVSGTAHWKTGSMDKVQQKLTDEFGIPVLCLWRNDISRRLDDAWNLKWVYPELMTGPDMIRYTFESIQTEAARRRATTIKAFIAYQYNTDKLVKFKQVDLQNDLINLFIDVPLKSPGKFYYTKNYRVERLATGAYIGEQYVGGSEPPWKIAGEKERNFTLHGSNEAAGAATYFLTTLASCERAAYVLEGAPGQGKSTITQYICQVNRMRLLQKSEDLAKIPKDHRDCPVYIPIKVDLRDFATWLARKNPFVIENRDAPIPNWDKSLESFLAALIANQSGGASFDVSDLHDIMGRTPIAIILDGLDEVADIKRRADVVGEIVKGSDRLTALSKEMRVIVTSRPTAFATAPGLPEEKFFYLGLGDVTRPLIDAYASKWLRARDAAEIEAENVKRILNEKVGQPHIRELARNTMQLAILLSLIYSRGASLPDKRTALYDSYVDLFFSREAEKTALVRDHHELLKDIHQYLAWLLHVESENGNGAKRTGNGAIEEDRLKTVLREYLRKEGRDEALADIIFTGVVERVVALVSRVQGTYEFEVQPLREYFAARYLYETAPYSPAGNERKGTKPDRFNALARNFYWLNVTRFYAGCYSKGELAALIDSLKELQDDREFCALSHPRILAATLLSDWVFSQQPKSVAEVVNVMFGKKGVKFLFAFQKTRSSDMQSIALSDQCGRGVLVDRCMQLLKDGCPPDFAFDIVELLKANGKKDELFQRWREELTRVEFDDQIKWLSHAQMLGIMHLIPYDVLTEMLESHGMKSDICSIIIRGSRTDAFEKNEESFKAGINCLLAGDISLGRDPRGRYLGKRLIAKLAFLLNPERYAAVFRAPAGVRIDSLWTAPEGAIEAELEVEPPSVPMLEAKRRVEYLIGKIQSLDQIQVQKWTSSLGPWSLLVDAISEIYGERVTALFFAILGASINASDETCVDSPDLFDTEMPLCRRVRYARLRAGTPAWWDRMLENASDEAQILFVCTLWAIWGSQRTVSKSFDRFNEVIEKLSMENWKRLSMTTRLNYEMLAPSIKLRSLKMRGGSVEVGTERTFVLLSPRMKNSDLDGLVETLVMNYDGKDIVVLDFLVSHALKLLIRETSDWQKPLEICRLSYERGEPLGRFGKRDRGRYFTMRSRLNEECAAAVAKHSEKYPTAIVAAAERTLREATARDVKTLSEVAKQDGWFL